MAVSILMGTFIAVGVVLFVLSYYLVERKKDITEEQKRAWYKTIIIPWVVSLVIGLLGVFLRERDYRILLEDTISVHKNQAEHWLKTERIPFEWRRK